MRMTMWDISESNNQPINKKLVNQVYISIFWRNFQKLFIVIFVKMLYNTR